MNDTPKREPSLRRAFLKMLWQQPLWAIPFAIFFGTVFGGGGWTSYLLAYRISLLFAYVIGFAVLGASAWLGHQHKEGKRRFPLWAEIVTYLVVSFVASLLAAFIAHHTVNPGMLGSGRSVAITGMFALLFTLLVTGIAYAYHFYGQALARARSEQELNMARRIQRGFLLSQFPSMPRLEVHALNVSSREVSGDFYDVVPTGDGAILLAIADVSGKGVPAALLSSMLQASLRTQAATVTSVGEILKNVNRLVYGTASPGQFATFFLARVDESKLRLSFSNAGHNYPMLFRRDGRRVDLECGGTVVGVLPDARFEEDAIDLEPGDRVVLYTDGISEAASPTGELFGEERLASAIATLPRGLTARDTIEQILAAVRAWLQGREPGDDMTLMVLRVLD
jgi:serine phosphatase RsbU (regulator of sigma subunit)